MTNQSMNLEMSLAGKVTFMKKFAVLHGAMSSKWVQAQCQYSTLNKERLHKATYTLLCWMRTRLKDDSAKFPLLANTLCT